ncbi:hypothetical protein GGQ85_000234 [Nitrobacter vulgaris]|nr:hypothetical protein [Nitrobacter vulgaris]
MAIHHPIAICKFHGLFPVRTFALSPGSTVTVLRCGTDCPQCGGPCEILPGTYRAGLDRINLLIDPSISLLALGAIRKLAERVKAGEITVEKAKHEAEKIHPKAARLFDIANWSDTAKATLLGAIITAAASFAVAKIASSPTININPTVVERVLTKPNQPAPRPKRPQKKQPRHR